MKTLEATQLVKTDGKIFTAVVKGKNFMTPYLKGYYAITNGEAELTEGTGFSNNDIYGVTVVRNNEHDYDAGKAFDSQQEAMDYINSL